jgi:hypothetical protein
VIESLVELVGIEPTTSSLRMMESAVHSVRVSNHLPRSNGEIGSFYWNVIGTCGSQVVRLNP